MLVTSGAYGYTLVVTGVLPKQVGHPHDAVYRCTDLMTHVCEELFLSLLQADQLSFVFLALGNVAAVQNKSFQPLFVL